MVSSAKGSGEASVLAASGDSNSIKVFVRVRPLTQGTELTTDRDKSLCLTVTSPNTIHLLSKPEPRTFTYDHVADMDTTQDAVFSSVAKNIVESCMNGYNGTIFAYGQTGSGKTFTMLGPSEMDNFTDELRGLIPRSFEYLFFLINREVEKSHQTKSFLCKCSFIEIYNEQIYDLLDTASASLFLRENIKKGVFVEGAMEKFVNSAAEAYQVLSMGLRNRRVASTSMNRESSRSHAVFTMTVESKESINEVVNIRLSQLNLVDLAGSERQKDTHTEGSRLKEANSINLSLMCLGQVIMALVDVSNGKNRHICYRDSKLTFLLRAVINEDMQGNVRQLQAEVKKLKEQLAQALACQGDEGKHVASGGPAPPMGPSVEIQHDLPYKAKFMTAVRLWKKVNVEKKMLVKKLAQMEEAWAQKDKFIHSSRMLLRFREDHICRLEKKLKAGESSLSDKESQALVDQLKKEIKILQNQVEHHPRMIQYAAENSRLKEENRQLRSLELVMKAEETAAEVADELEEVFQKAMEAERESSGVSSTTLATDAAMTAAIEKLNAKLLQKESDLRSALQAFEKYKEITKKQLTQLESEKKYLEKSNIHLENILEATKACKKQEVSELNRIHVETIKILTTPTKAYNLRSRLVPHFSPELLKEMEEKPESIWAEDPPSDMTEMALIEELRQVQEQVSHVQTQLNEEELKNSRLLQQTVKLEEQIGVLSQDSEHKDELLSAERSKWDKIQFTLKETINNLQESLESEHQAAEVLQSENSDLRLVLQSSDKELASLKNEIKNSQSEHQGEMSQLSNNLINTQLQLDKVRLEWEQLLEQHRVLQDSFDQMQAEAKFEADQARQQLHDGQQEINALKAEVVELKNSLQTEQEHSNTLVSQLKENKESASKELIETVDQNTQLRKQVSVLTVQNQQQASKFAELEQSLSSANEMIQSLKQKAEQDKTFVVDLINQARDVRGELSQKDQTINHLTEDIRDITAKSNAACLEREDLREQNRKMQKEICDLRETLDRGLTSNKIEVELLQEEIVYASEEVERLTKVVDEQNSLLQAAQEETAQKDAMIHNLQQNLQKQQADIEKTVRNDLFQPLESAVTPKSLPQTPCTPGSFSRDLSQVLESQERELENRRSSIITMEVLLAELNAERTAKNAEIQRLKAQLAEKEIVQMEIQTMLDRFYIKEKQLTENGSDYGDKLKETIEQSMFQELEEERKEKMKVMEKLSKTEQRLQEQECVLAQTQTCVQELTTELRNRCLELRDMNLRVQDEEKLLQENDLLRKQNIELSEENGKLVGHKNHKQRIEYLVQLKKSNTKLQEENEKLRTEVNLMRENSVCPPMEMT
ncbi:kinesin-like protein KIF15 isoform 2-T2 [Pholidichthys leucotaenia]